MAQQGRSQSVRQRARRAAQAAQAAVRADRVQREKRLGALGVDVAVAIAERDAAIARHERAAGLALAAMMQEGGVSATEAASWCGEQVGSREVQRLLQLVTAGEGSTETTESDS